jgi:hypothetical protein
LTVRFFRFPESPDRHQPPGLAESDIGPDRELRQPVSGIFLEGIELGDQILVRAKTGNPALDFTRGNMFP